MFENYERVLPKFDEDTCREYLKNTLKKSSTNQRLFDLPTLIKKLPGNKKYCNKSSKIIEKMKSSGLTFPFDKISTLALKRCPILLTSLHRITSHCWLHQKVPHC